MTPYLLRRTKLVRDMTLYEYCIIAAIQGTSAMSEYSGFDDANRKARLIVDLVDAIFERSLSAYASNNNPVPTK